MDVFQEPTEPIMLKPRGHMGGLESEVGKAETELTPAHRMFA